MHLARRALRQADPLATTVTVIATEHGFWDLGRFAAVYRKLFGELPSETLRLGVAEAASIAPNQENPMPASEIT
jgi:AraC-like DNA-binding protein